MSVILNFWGGPGAGKSTMAAYAYALLKRRGCNAELVQEYVKSWAWDKRQYNDFDQIYFLGKQTRAETKLYGKVDYIVTDCPILLGSIYADRYSPPEIGANVLSSALAVYRHAARLGHRHRHFSIRRGDGYDRAGRYENEADARSIDRAIDDRLRLYYPDYEIIRQGTMDIEERLSTICQPRSSTCMVDQVPVSPPQPPTSTTCSKTVI